MAIIMVKIILTTTTIVLTIFKSTLLGHDKLGMGRSLVILEQPGLSIPVWPISTRVY